MSDDIKINQLTKVSRNPDVAWRILGDQLIAITPTDNCVHRFNETGSFIWKCLEKGPEPLSELIQKVEGHFEMSEKVVELEVINFVKEITEKGIVKIEY